MNEKAFPEEAVLVCVCQCDGENFPFSADIFLLLDQNLALHSTLVLCLWRQLTAAFGAKSRFADVQDAAEHESKLFFIALCCGLPR